MPPTGTTGESLTKIQKKRNVVTVWEDYSLQERRWLPIDEPFDIDEDDLRVLDSLIQIQLPNVMDFDNVMDVDDLLLDRRELAPIISTDSHRRVTKLELNGFTGVALPPGALDALDTLDLREVPEISEIPEWICELKNLKTLLLPTYGNDIVEFPDEFRNLTNLEKVTFVPSRFKDIREDNDADVVIPGSIAKIPNLKVLEATWCVFLPEELQNLTSLERLILYNHKVPLLPTSIGKITSLKQLGICNSVYLKALPDSIGQLTNLQKLTLEDNENLKSLPESIENLTSLESLAISKNHYSMSLPTSIQHLPKLKHLWLDFMRSLPDFIGNISTLKTLGLFGAKISSLPPSLHNLTNLEHLNLSFSQIRNLPEHIANLTNLRFLGLSGSEIETLPDLQKLKKLRYLRLDGTPFEDDWTSFEEIVQRYPWVTCFGDFDLKPTPKHTAYINKLYSRRVKDKVVTVGGNDPSFPSSLWPLILAKESEDYNDEAFDGHYVLTCYCCDLHDDIQPEYADRPDQKDVQFQLLKQFGHKFISTGC